MIDCTDTVSKLPADCLRGCLGLLNPFAEDQDSLPLWQRVNQLQTTVNPFLCKNADFLSLIAEQQKTGCRFTRVIVCRCGKLLDPPQESPLFQPPEFRMLFQHPAHCDPDFMADAVIDIPLCLGKICCNPAHKEG